MAASLNRRKLTPYESIPVFTNSLKVYSVKDITRIDDLVEAMRAWNLHGTANNLEAWRVKMYKHITAEHQEYDWTLPNG